MAGVEPRRVRRRRRTAHPGHVVSVLTPTSRYMQPFLSHLAASADPTAELRIVHGKGRFGLQVASSAEAYAWQLGFSHVSTGPAAAILSDELPEDWVLITAGTFEEATETVTRARCLAKPPRVTFAVAAGVREFREAVESPDGTFGIAQWFPESGQPALLAPASANFWMLTTPRPASCPAIRRHKPPPPRCLRCTALGRRAAQTGNSHGQPLQPSTPVPSSAPSRSIRPPARR